MREVKIINSKTLLFQEKDYAEKLKKEILAEEQAKKTQESAKKEQREFVSKDTVK